MKLTNLSIMLESHPPKHSALCAGVAALYSKSFCLPRAEVS